MNALNLPHEIGWVAAPPLWDPNVPAALRRPALLGFASDAFMEELAQDLGQKPPQLSARIAKAESAREAPAGAPPDWKPPAGALKLYQPAHGRFYLVAASLVCQLPGLPDHRVDTAADERTTFVLRRLTPQGGELAWVGPASGRRWEPVPDAARKALVTGEELNPMFPQPFKEGDRRRKLWLGLVPTASGETFQAPELVPPANQQADMRVELIEQRLVEPLDGLKALVAVGGEQGAAVESSRMWLLDLAGELQANHRPVWDALQAGTTPGGTAGAVRNLLVNRLVSPGGRTIAAALAQAWQQRDRINEEATPESTVNDHLGFSTLSSSELKTALINNLGPKASSPSATPPPQSIGKLEAVVGARYVIRCVYRRPRCGPLHRDVVSERSEPFAIAPFFDPDAPARPVRITLPDTSLASLRKFKKNVGFALGKQLRKQLTQTGEMLDKKKLSPGLSFDLGELCSFSIPIITLCAFVVLMIMLSLLNIIFWWMPFLRICLPILRPKEE